MRDSKIREGEEKENDVHSACLVSVVPLSFESALDCLCEEEEEKRRREDRKEKTY